MPLELTNAEHLSALGGFAARNWGQRNRGSGCSKDGLRSPGELLRAEYAKGQIKVSVIEPNQIEWRLIQIRLQTFMLDNAMAARHQSSRSNGNRGEPSCRGGGGAYNATAGRATIAHQALCLALHDQPAAHRIFENKWPYRRYRIVSWPCTIGTYHRICPARRVGQIYDPWSSMNPVCCLPSGGAAQRCSVLSSSGGQCPASSRFAGQIQLTRLALSLDSSPADESSVAPPILQRRPSKTQ